jgi:hypothetical protein
MSPAFARPVACCAARTRSSPPAARRLRGRGPHRGRSRHARRGQPGARQAVAEEIEGLIDEAPRVAPCVARYPDLACCPGCVFTARSGTDPSCQSRPGFLDLRPSPLLLRACAYALPERVVRAGLVSCLGPVDDPAAKRGMPAPTRYALAVAQLFTAAREPDRLANRSPSTRRQADRPAVEVDVAARRRDPRAGRRGGCAGHEPHRVLPAGALGQANIGDKRTGGRDLPCYGSSESIGASPAGLSLIRSFIPMPSLRRHGLGRVGDRQARHAIGRERDRGGQHRERQ